MNKQIDLDKIRAAWQPLSKKELFDDECINIVNDIDLFFKALCRMKEELEIIRKEI